MTPIVQSMFATFLFADDLLDLAGLFLNFAVPAFFFAFAFQFWVTAQIIGNPLSSRMPDFMEILLYDLCWVDGHCRYRL